VRDGGEAGERKVSGIKRHGQSRGSGRGAEGNAARRDGFYLDCGRSGTRFKTAPAVGLCMAELILDGAAKTVNIEALRPGRFAEGRPVKGNCANIWR